MEQSDILFTGGSGLLGRTMRKALPEALYPSHWDFDVTDPEMMEQFITEVGRFDTVVHAAALISPPKVQKDPASAMQANIVGTCNVVDLCMRHDMRLVYISTDYVFDGGKGNYRESDPVFPVNKYAWSKLGGECAVRMHDKSLIVRTSFGPDEFPYDGAFADQWTSRLNVSALAERLLPVVMSNVVGVLHVGGPRRTVYEYARGLTRKQLKEMHIDEMPVRMPSDTSLDCSLYSQLFGTETMRTA